MHLKKHESQHFEGLVYRKKAIHNIFLFDQNKSDQGGSLIAGQLLPTSGNVLLHLST